jgi:DNA mismatch repair ATPase MutS
VIGELDALISLSEISSFPNYVRPKMFESEKASVRLINFRHPLLEQILQGKSFYVPNSCQLDQAYGTAGIITGPNMGGKSSFLRGVGLVCLLAHLGCYVPAECAEISVMDSIFCRSGASDKIMANQSTLFVELTEASNIIHRATPKSLVLIDELGRGTSTFDGAAIAFAVLQRLINVGCAVLFITHYHSLVYDVIASHPNQCKAYYCSFENANNDRDSSQHKKIVWMYKMVHGICPESYAMEVAALAGIQPSILGRAKEKAEEFNMKSANTSSH